jgi:hypothetical protein
MKSSVNDSDSSYALTQDRACKFHNVNYVGASDTSSRMQKCQDT